MARVVQGRRLLILLSPGLDDQFACYTLRLFASLYSSQFRVHTNIALVSGYHSVTSGTGPCRLWLSARGHVLKLEISYGAR